MTTLTCPSPVEVKPLYGSGNYIFSLNKFPDFTFMIQETELPQITLGVSTLSSSVSDAPVPGEALEFGTLSATFVVDEKMTNYMSIHNWLVGMGFPENHEMYKNLMLQQTNALAVTELSKGYTDGTLHILGNNNRPIVQAKFVDCFPTSLSGLSFSSSNTDSSPLTAIVTFEYNYYLLSLAT